MDTNGRGVKDGGATVAVFWLVKSEQGEFDLVGSM
jgi:hypothetical protein